MAAAVAAAASGANAQAAEGRARQAAVRGADDGGIFAAFLAQLFQSAPPGPTQDQAAAQQSALNVQQGIQAATQNSSALGASGTPSARLAGSAKLALAVAEQAQTLTNGNGLPALDGSVSPASSDSGASTPSAYPHGLQDLPPEQMLKLLRLMAQSGQTGASGNPALTAALQSLLAGTANTNSTSGNAQATPNAQATSNVQSSMSGTAPSATGTDPTTIAALMQALAQQAQGNQAPNASQQAASGQTATSAPVSAATSPTGTVPAPPALPGPAPQALPSTAQTPVNNIAPALTDTERQLFAHVSQAALHQNSSAPVTEAKALPINAAAATAASGTAGQSGQQSGHGSANTNWPVPQEPGTSSADAVSNAAVPPFAPLAHDGAQANGAPPSSSLALPDSTSAFAAAPAGSIQQAVALQVGPAPQTQDSLPPQSVQAIAVSIASQSQTGSKQFNIRLDPPELGRVDVRLMVDATGKAQAHLAVDKPQTLELLQRDSDSLARALKDSGVQLNNNGLQFSLKGQDRQGSGNEPRSRPLAVAAAPVSATSTTSVSSSLLPASASGVDIRV